MTTVYLETQDLYAMDQEAPSNQAHGNEDTQLSEELTLPLPTPGFGYILAKSHSKQLNEYMI